MPWHIENDNADCSGFAVVKDADGSVAGCHQTEADAKGQLAALYANEPDARSETGDFHTLELPEVELEVRNAARREIDARIVPWQVPIDTMQGRELFERGAFRNTNADDVLLMGLEHAARLGLNQAGQPTLARVPVGKAIGLSDEQDGQHATFRVAKTADGDELLALAIDKVVRGVSVEFTNVPGGTTTEMRDGRRTNIHRLVNLRGVTATYRPAYHEAQILAVRSAEGVPTVPEETAPIVAEPVEIDLSPITKLMAAQEERFTERFAKLEERNRSEFSIPATVQTAPEIPGKGVWTQSVLRMLSGERIPEMQMRALADLVTTDNIGVVPPAYLTEIIGVINRRRPFLESTRRLGTPASGMSLVVPRIVTRPTVGIQVAEKDELTSTKTEIDTVTFDAVTKGGAGDISLQLLKRSDPSFLSLYLELLFEAYALDAEQEAVAALLGLGSGGFGSGGFGNGGVNDGGSLDPENADFGDAWINGYETMYGGPDTIWLSSEAVGAFIDAKATTTNSPLYWTLQANFSMPGGVGGSISGMRPVHVPALNGTGVDILVGPSNGFAWAEDGTYTLQVDVPAKAGRDVAVVGILWFCPLYPTAFTGWALGGS